MDDSIAKSEQPLCEGSDSGVEMNSKCTCHRSTLAEADSETDSCLMGNSNGYSPSIYFCTDTNDLVSSTIRQLSVGECEHNGENSPMSYDAASENGSESSSVDDSKKCKSNCGTVSKLSSYCTKVNRRQATTSSGRSRSSPFPTDALKFGASKPSSNPKCALSISDPDAVKSKLPVTEARNRSIRSCSVTRTRTPVSPDETKCTADSRLSRNRGLPSAGMSEKITTFDTYATLPRRKQREVVDSKNSPRDPSLNRAASLRKKFLENSLMTTSMNASIGSSSSLSPSSFSRTLPPYVKARQIKTKIYLEAASQTLLTNDDVDHALSDHPFNIYNEVEIQAEAEYRIKKRYEEQMNTVTEELKKLKKENSKQRTIIEWLEGELATAKDEKFALQNKYTTVEKKVHSLLRYEGVCENVFHQLEREVTASNSLIAQQKEEIADLQQMCSALKRDLEQSYSAQKTILEVQKASEVESLELQEFLQAEKSTLTDSLKDTEQELAVCRARLVQKEQEISYKQSEYEKLETMSEQLRQEKEVLKTRLWNLERLSRELLLHQGAVISSASVALSGLGSRFDQLLDQLVTAYSISKADLQDECRLNQIFDHNISDRSGGDQCTRSMTNSSRADLSIPCLKVIRSFISRTPVRKEDCSGSSESSASKQLLESSDNSKQSLADSQISVLSSASDETIVATDRRKSSNLNLISSDDAFCLSRLDLDNVIFPDTYVTDDNVTLDFTVSGLLNDLSRKQSLDNGSTLDFLKDYSNRDVSLVEQITELDKLVTKVFKAFSIALYKSFQRIMENQNENVRKNNMNSEYKNCSDGGIMLTSISSFPNREVYMKQNYVNVPDIESNAIAFVRLQHKTVTNLLLVLHQMQDAVDGSTILKKIQADLRDMDRMCNSFLSAGLYDTAV